MLVTRPKVVEPVFSLYTRPLHPEFFETVARRSLCRNFYEVSVSITNVGHVLSWTDGCHSLTEVVSSVHHELPPGAVFRDTLHGKHQRTPSLAAGIAYRSHFRLESVEPETLLLMDRELARDVERDGLVHRFGLNGRIALGAVSYVRLDSRLKRLRIQSVHTFPDNLTLVRTETTIELGKVEKQEKTVDRVKSKDGIIKDSMVDREDKEKRSDVPSPFADFGLHGFQTDDHE